MKLGSTSFCIITACFLTGCGPSVEDARKLGFSSVAEMEAAKAQGYEDKDELDRASAKLLGFESVAEMKTLQSKGFVSKPAYLLSEARRLGFSTTGEMRELQAQGYATKTDYIRKETERAISLGFQSYDEWNIASRLGFETKKEYDEHLWREEFFPTVRNYYEKTKLFDNPMIYANRSRAEQKEWDEMVEKSKRVLRQAIGKELRDIQCWYLGRQIIADTELWCYSSKNSGEQFLFIVNISRDDAKKIGTLYKDDEFKFTGKITNVDLDKLSVDGGFNVTKYPPTIKLNASSITQITN